MIVFLTLSTMIVAPIMFGGKINERDARLLEVLIAQLHASHPSDAELAASLANGPARDLNLAVYDRTGTFLYGDPSKAAPSARELEVRAGRPYVERDRVVVELSPTRVVVEEPGAPPVPFEALLVLLGLILVLTLVATTWFARSIARPLAALSETARALGRGDTAARVRLARQDELGEVGRSFDEMADRVGQLLQTQRAMMADISHELRTPLTRIKLALDLATADPRAAQQVLDDVGADLEEIEQIIEDVFAMVRLDSDARMGKGTVDLRELARRSAARFTDYHQGRSITLELPAAEAAISGDAALVRRALDNLLDNAAKYSPPDAAVTLRLGAEGGTWVFEVIDRGIGMTESELGHAFTPFWRADSSRARTTGGVGLGLALARRIARAHGGDVELTSSRGSGTRARLVLRSRSGER
ncbi:MAG: HAMP domain-containing sensor histidine kinase [Kofleriaceae bacterium]|nr:HAMP domain-containing sensor histidine kinase [Kofleriaceae bacterium]